jgi:GTP-binding protein
VSVDDPAADLAILREELGAYDPTLVTRPSILVATKTDLVDDPVEAVGALPGALPVSAMTGEGIDELLDRLGLLTKEAEAAEPERAAHVVLRPGRPKFTITRDDAGRWHVVGRNVERWVMETDMFDEGETAELGRRLKREGVERKLVSLGARHGDEVVIREKVFEFLPDPTPGASEEPEEEV